MDHVTDVQYMFPCTSHATCLNSSKKKREISGGKRQLPSPKSHPERDRSVEGRGWESHLGGGERFSRSPTSDWLVCKLCVKFNAWTWFGYVDDFEVLGQVDLIVCLFVCLFVCFGNDLKLRSEYKFTTCPFQRAAFVFFFARHRHGAVGERSALWSLEFGSLAGKLSVCR